MVKLEDMITVYYKARANKRRSRDAVRFEMDFKAGLLQLWRSVNERTFTAHSNYAFVVRRPKPREIFATVMETRIIHHYIDWRMRSIYEKVLSDRSFNNRKGKGLHAAIKTFRDDICELSCNYTKDAWCIHLDLKGYFPNADVEIALAQQLGLIERYYDGDDKDDLKYMIEVCMRADPARHCSVFVPCSNWDVIAPEKSLFNKPTGTGGAIGFLCWQNAMGLYINDVVKWLQSHDFMRVVVFVDDIYIVTADKSKALAIIPELRERLAALKVRLNEKKFYCQHYSKGIMCLGSMLKFDRIYTSNKTTKSAFYRFSTARVCGPLKYVLPNMLASVNSTLGIFSGKTSFKVVSRLQECVSRRLGKFLELKPGKQSFIIREKFKRNLRRIA